MQQKCKLQEFIESHTNHKCKFFPKFHCEFNVAELEWMNAKQRFRKQNNMDDKNVVNLINQCLNEIPVQTHRKYFHKVRRIVKAYSKGATSTTLSDVLARLKKEHKQHRFAPSL